MKKLIMVLVIIIMTGITLYGMYSLFLKRTPEKLLKQEFNISLTGFDYTIESFEEQWYPNGDGYALIVYKFNSLTQGNIDYFNSFNNVQSLPILEAYRQQMPPNSIPKQYLNANAGCYIYKVESVTDYRDFKIFIVDTEKRIAVLYYQYM